LSSKILGLLLIAWEFVDEGLDSSASGYISLLDTTILLAYLLDIRIAASIAAQRAS